MRQGAVPCSHVAAMVFGNAAHPHTKGILTSPAGYHGNCREGLLSGQSWKCVLNYPILSPEAAVTPSGPTELRPHLPAALSLLPSPAWCCRG